MPVAPGGVIANMGFRRHDIPTIRLRVANMSSRYNGSSPLKSGSRMLTGVLALAKGRRF
jgi:hypothetical protein